MLGSLVWSTHSFRLSQPFISLFLIPLASKCECHTKYISVFASSIDCLLPYGAGLTPCSIAARLLLRLGTSFLSPRMTVAITTSPPCFNAYFSFSSSTKRLVVCTVCTQLHASQITASLSSPGQHMSLVLRTEPSIRAGMGIAANVCLCEGAPPLPYSTRTTLSFLFFHDDIPGRSRMNVDRSSTEGHVACSSPAWSKRGNTRLSRSS